MKITVAGAGSWGTALALLLGKKHDVTLYSNIQEQADTINRDHENKEFLPGIEVPEKIQVITDLDIAAQTELIVFAVPSNVIRNVLENFADHIKQPVICVNVAKGIDSTTLKRISEMMEEILPDICEIAVLSGPSHAEEVAKGIPTAVVTASKSNETAKKVQDAFMQDTFRVYTSDDLVGVEMGGTVKNVIALAAGVCDGLGYGDNTKAALMTRGMAEMAQLGKVMNGRQETFAGLTGMGDLIVTCTSMHSRNRRAGILIGQGKSLAKALDEVHMVVEGVYAARAVAKLAERYNVNMPITREINSVLFNGKNPKQAVADLMTRDKKGEHEYD